MTTIICGYTDCSYNVKRLCGRNFVNVGVKRYGVNLHPCSGFTREKVNDIIPEIYTIELKNEKEVEKDV